MKNTSVYPLLAEGFSITVVKNTKVKKQFEFTTNRGVIVSVMPLFVLPSTDTTFMSATIKIGGENILENIVAADFNLQSDVQKNPIIPVQIEGGQSLELVCTNDNSVSDIKLELIANYSNVIFSPTFGNSLGLKRKTHTIISEINTTEVLEANVEKSRGPIIGFSISATQTNATTMSGINYSLSIDGVQVIKNLNGQNAMFGNIISTQFYPLSILSASTFAFTSVNSNTSLGENTHMNLTFYYAN